MSGLGDGVFPWWLPALREAAYQPSRIGNPLLRDRIIYELRLRRIEVEPARIRDMLAAEARSYGR
jgi:hypothetical protein